MWTNFLEQGNKMLSAQGLNSHPPSSLMITSQMQTTTLCCNLDTMTQDGHVSHGVVTSAACILNLVVVYVMEA